MQSYKPVDTKLSMYATYIWNTFVDKHRKSSTPQSNHQLVHPMSLTSSLTKITLTRPSLFFSTLFQSTRRRGVSSKLLATESFCMQESNAKLAIIAWWCPKVRWAWSIMVEVWFVVLFLFWLLWLFRGLCYIYMNTNSDMCTLLSLGIRHILLGTLGNS